MYVSALFGTPRSWMSYISKKREKNLRLPVAMCWLLLQQTAQNVLQDVLCISISWQEFLRISFCAHEQNSDSNRLNWQYSLYVAEKSTSNACFLTSFANRNEASNFNSFFFCALTISICNTTSAVHKTLASKTLLWLQSCLLVQFVWESLRYLREVYLVKIGMGKSFVQS